MLQQLLTALQATQIPFEAYGWRTAPTGDYGIVSLDGQAGSVGADNRIVEQAPEGTIDFFTKNIATTSPVAIQEAINALDYVSWALNSVQYETDSGYIHWEWVFRLTSL